MRSTFRKPLLICCIAVAMTNAIPASAEDHLEELFLSPLAYTQERSELQVAMRTALEEGETALALEYGLTDRLQIEAESALHSDAGSSPLSVGLKYRPAISSLRGTAFGVELSSEEGNRSVETYAVVSREFRQMHWLTHVAPSFDGHGISEWQAGAAGVIPVSRGFLTAEIVWNHESGEEGTATFAPGFAIPLGDLIEIGISAKFGSDGNHGVLAGVRLNTSLGKSE